MTPSPVPAPSARPAFPTLRGGLAALVLIALSACGEQELYAKLDERQANEMVAVLQLAGIPAEKAAREGGYTVSAPQSEFARAVQTLRAMGLPREDFDSLGKVFKREGFVSTPLEERSRLVHALSQELSRTVSSIDGVVLARVTLAMPEKHPLSDKVVPSSASVLIKHRPGLDVEALVPKIRALVVNSVEGLPYDSVTVVPFVAEAWLPAPPPPDAVPESLRAALWGAGLVGLGSLAAAGAVAWRRRPEGRAWPPLRLAGRKPEAPDVLP
ncbi:MAG TPA: type III secretion inner membrane ring lipoprotein SctJ [Ideonella sp.]|nr:type III secretion inner membrane ring lipoprotein SctJ [Ideonella sp.]